MLSLLDPTAVGHQDQKPSAPPELGVHYEVLNMNTRNQ